MLVKKWKEAAEGAAKFHGGRLRLLHRYIAYTDGDRCVELACQPFAQFHKEWVLETVRGIEYKYNARKRQSS